MQDKPIIALLYDFDKTLCTQDMQNYTFIPSLGMEPGPFWEASNDFSRKEQMDSILTYLYMMVRKSREKNIPLTKETLRACGEDVQFFPGVLDWFTRIDAFGESLGVQVEHYVISSGLREIIDGTPIAKFFKKIYACEFYYDEEGHPVWPKLAVNFTAKTQFVYRINKGVLDVSNDRDLNASMPENSKRVRFHNMIYLGDGLSDVPCMKMMRAYGGQAIAVYQETNRAAVEQLLRQKRVDYIFPADYRENSGLDKTIKLILQKMMVDEHLIRESNCQLQSIR